MAPGKNKKIEYYIRLQVGNKENSKHFRRQQADVINWKPIFSSKEESILKFSMFRIEEAIKIDRDQVEDAKMKT